MLETKLAVVTNLSLKRSTPDVNALDKLTVLVADDLKACNALIIDRMQSPVELIPQLAGYIIAAGGKRLRPVLTLASGRGVETRRDSLSPRGWVCRLGGPGRGVHRPNG